MSKIPPPSFHPLPLGPDSPPWVIALEHCRQALEFLDGSETETAEELHHDLIEENYSYIKFGLRLRKTLADKIYQGCKTFEEYCLKFIRKSGRHCRRIMLAAYVSWSLIKHGFEILPGCISQAAQLAEISGVTQRAKPAEIETMAEKWGRVVAAAKISNTPITTNFIVRTLEPNSYQGCKIKLNEATYDAAKELARVYQEKAGVDVNANEYVQILIQDTYLRQKESQEPESSIPVTDNTKDKPSVETSIKNSQYKFEISDEVWLLLGEISQEKGVAPESILESAIRRLHSSFYNKKPQAPSSDSESVDTEKQALNTDSDEIAIAKQKIEALGIDWKSVKHEVTQNIHYLDTAIEVLKQYSPRNPVAYLKAVLKNRGNPKSQSKHQSQINKNIEAMEKRCDEWWERLGILWGERDLYLVRRGNIIEFIKEGTADALNRISSINHQEFINLVMGGAT
ncbi:MAG: hypothetical protein AB4080_01950 [Trichodesmium sp.]